MWDLPKPGLEPVFPALAGRFSTTAPPGSPQQYIFMVKLLRASNTVLSTLDLLEGGGILLPVVLLKSVWPQNLLSMEHLAGLLVLLGTHFWKYCTRSFFLTSLLEYN